MLLERCHLGAHLGEVEHRFDAAERGLELLKRLAAFRNRHVARAYVMQNESIPPPCGPIRCVSQAGAFVSTRTEELGRTPSWVEGMTVDGRMVTLVAGAVPTPTASVAC